MMMLTVLMAVPLMNTPMMETVQNGGCLKHKKFRPVINYTVQKEPTQFIYHHNKKSLTRQSQASLEEWKQKHEGNAWLSGMGKNAKWHTEGITKGAMGVSTKFELVGKPYDKYGVYYCPYVKRLDVTITYSSEIFIASEIKKGTCEFDAVMEHEFKHHDTNLTIVKTLAKTMEADTPKLLRFMERRYVTRGKIDQAFATIKLGIKDALKVYAEEMGDRMEEFNGHIDTPEEYRAVSLKCKKAHKHTKK